MIVSDSYINKSRKDTCLLTKYLLDIIKIKKKIIVKELKPKYKLKKTQLSKLALKL